MKIDDEGLNFIASQESFRASPYKDIAGNLTIGYGHFIKPGEKFTVLTEAAAKHLLFLDAETAMNCVNKAVNVKLTQNQFNALVDFTYNLGCGALNDSTLLKLLNQGEYTQASEQFGRWVYAGGKKIPDLIRRRGLEQKMFDEGMVST